MKQLIVNADDFGLSVGTNTGIIKCMRDGIVTSASLMACGQAFDDACRQYQSMASADIGVHLVLDEETPVLAPEKIPSLVDAHGRFLDRGTLLKRLLFSQQIRTQEVRAEFRAQIQKCLDANIPISHLDGHGHVHVYPKIVPIVCELATEFHIPRVRLPGETLAYADLKNFSPKKYINKAIVASFSILAKKHFKQNGIQFPDTFFGMVHGGNLTDANLQKILQRLPATGVTEIMSHPGDEDSSRGQRYGHWEYNWEKESAALQQYTPATLKQQWEIELIPFSKFAGGPVTKKS